MSDDIRRAKYVVYAAKHVLHQASWEHEPDLLWNLDLNNIKEPMHSSIELTQ